MKFQEVVTNYKTKVEGILLCVLFLSSCTNIKSFTSNKNTVSSSPSLTAGSSGDNYTISNVTILPTSTGGASSTTYNVSLFFNVTSTAPSISNHCNTVSGSKPCACQFTWNETNQTGGTAVLFQRSTATAAIQVQPNVVVCLAPQAYGGTPPEIADGTQIKISVVAGAGNTDTFSMTPYLYKKATNTTAGSFQDSQGRSFDNILRYGCYERFQRGLSIASYVATVTDPATGEQRRIPLASKFCVASATGGTSTDQSCAGLTPADYSAQANFYNLYIRSSERGDVNSGNLKYVCPLVDKALQTNAVKANYWPLDTSFALALGPSANFNIGVESYTKTDVGDGSAVSNSCFPTSNPSSTSSSGSSSAGTSLIRSCLGFAATPNTDGSCPNIQNSSGQLVPLYLLRRYIAVYPKVFDTNGQPYPNLGQASDSIYVVDRPVLSAFADPLKPYTMRGPKPCPFAYFDKQKVLGTPFPSYGATSNTGWKNKNVDGIQFPNVDIGDDTRNNISCSAIVPITDPTKSIISLGTVNAANPALPNMYVRPITPWAPHYEEDLSFQACAPLSRPGIIDPPLHFSKDAKNNVTYCAETYPTQNTNVAALDTQISGSVAPFTSHVAKNSASGVCAATIPPSLPLGYPGAGYATHPNTLVADPNGGAPINSDKTCDKTVTSTGLDWQRFPLIAPPADMEAAMNKDSSYACAVTWDNGGSKSQNKNSPAQGCCGTNVTMTTGAGGFSSAHLEPDQPCLTPNY